MATGNESATFGLNLSGNAAEAATAAADAFESMRSSISAGQASVKEMSANLRNLRGSTDAVRKAKDELKAKLDTEKEAISKSTLELLKQQKALGTTADAAKKAAAERKKLEEKLKADGLKVSTDRASALGSAVSSAGGPIASLREKLGGLKDIAGEGGAGGAMGFLALGAAGAVAAVAALTVAAVSGIVALAKFVIHGADAARSVGLLREAAMAGNAQWGKNFGEQVDELAKRVPTSKAEIDKLGRSLAASRIGGQIWVDTLNAVTQASAALGDEAGSKIKEFIERGRQLGRLQINPQEMINAGLDFNDVAASLATNMKISITAAKQALFEGRVKLGDGAKALRDAVEKKLGGINLRQMLSLDNITKKLGESFDALTKNVNLEPLLKGMKEVLSVFDLSTVSGQALKQIVEVFGTALTGSFTGLVPLAKKFTYGLIIGAQQIVIAYLEVRNKIRDSFSDSSVLKNIDGLKLAVDAGKVAIVGLGVACLMTAGFLAAVAAPFVLLGGVMYGMAKAIEFTIDTIKSLGKAFTSLDWASVGKSIPDGIVDGLKMGAGALAGGIEHLAEDTKNRFKRILGIASPSKVFKAYGENTTDGYVEGVEKGSDGAQAAVGAMVSTPRGDTGGGARAAAPSIVVNLTINASGESGQKIASDLSSDSFLDQLTQAVIDAIQGGGVPFPG